MFLHWGLWAPRMDLATLSGVAVVAPAQEAMKGSIAFEPLGLAMTQHLMGKCLARSGGDGRCH